MEQITSKKQSTDTASVVNKTSHLYTAYYNMLTRCYNGQNTSDWQYYGGKGIKVCKQWLNSRTKFIKWGLKNGFEEGLQIDRINCDKDYKPSNCRFVTRQQNLANRCGDKPFARTHQLPRNVYPIGKHGYQVSMKRNGQSHYIGFFNTVRQAVIARNKATARLAGQYANVQLN